MRDFPPLAWFASSVVVPRCLIRALWIVKDKETGERRTILVEEGVMHALALHRIALGFPAAKVPVVPWPEHAGYRTREGGELNESARDVGDDPDTWWVSDTPVDVMQASELYISRKIMAPKLFRSDASLLADVKRTVALCRSQPGVFIPPTWLTTDQAQQLARSLDLPVAPLPDNVA
jgi:hypothetical protein